MYSVTLQYVLDSKLPIFNKKEDSQFFKEDLYVSLSEVELSGFVSIPGETTNSYRPIYSPRNMLASVPKEVI
ncbi:hypothetical protein ACYYIK_002904 [Listeria monocytogenes]